jgi:hypothetical protein
MQIRGLKCGRPELVPEPLLLSSTKNYIGLAQPSERVSSSKTHAATAARQNNLPEKLTWVKGAGKKSV